jgi:hypothetical protein
LSSLSKTSSNMSKNYNHCRFTFSF